MSCLEYVLLLDYNVLFLDYTVLFLDYTVLFLDYNVSFLAYNVLFLDYNVSFLDYNVLFLDYNVVVARGGLAGAAEPSGGSGGGVTGVPALTPAGKDGQKNEDDDLADALAMLLPDDGDPFQGASTGAAGQVSPPARDHAPKFARVNFRPLSRPSSVSNRSLWCFETLSHLGANRKSIG
eukprot:1177984-Prorocentrum_minimum.AAC.8